MIFTTAARSPLRPISNLRTSSRHYSSEHFHPSSLFLSSSTIFSTQTVSKQFYPHQYRSKAFSCFCTLQPIVIPHSLPKASRSVRLTHIHQLNRGLPSVAAFVFTSFRKMYRRIGLPVSRSVLTSSLQSQPSSHNDSPFQYFAKAMNTLPLRFLVLKGFRFYNN